MFICLFGTTVSLRFLCAKKMSIMARINNNPKTPIYPRWEEITAPVSIPITGLIESPIPTKEKAFPICSLS